MSTDRSIGHAASQRDFGLDAVNRVKERIAGNSRCVRSMDRGFAWPTFGLRVWSGQPFIYDRRPHWRVHGTMETLRAVRARPEYVREIIGEFNCAGFAAYVFFENERTIRTCWAVTVSEANYEWSSQLFFDQALVQLLSNADSAGMMKDMLGGKVPPGDFTGVVGYRGGPKDTADVAQARWRLTSEVFSKKAAHCPWDSDEERREVTSLLAHLDVDHDLDGTTITARFPASDRDTSVLKITPLSVTPDDVKTGALSCAVLTVTTPLSGSPNLIAEIANSFNNAERFEEHAAHFCGGWGVKDETLTLYTLLPCVSYKPGLLSHIVISTISRVHWFHRRRLHPQSNRETRSVTSVH